MKSLHKVLTIFILVVLVTVFSDVRAFASEIEDKNIVDQGQVVSEASTDNQAVEEANGEEDASETLEDEKDNSEEAVAEENEDIKEETKKEETKKTETKKTETKKEEAKKETTKKKEEAKKPSYSQKDLRLLTSLIYSEAGNQSYNGMLAVANVVINRAKSDAYWHVDTIKEVIYDRKWGVQFSVTIKNKSTGLSPMDKALKAYDTGKFSTSNPTVSKNNMKRAKKAAIAALEGKNNIGKYLCFTNKRNTQSIQNKYSFVIIGDHIFYRTK